MSPSKTELEQMLREAFDIEAEWQASPSNGRVCVMEPSDSDKMFCLGSYGKGSAPGAVQWQAEAYTDSGLTKSINSLSPAQAIANLKEALAQAGALGNSTGIAVHELLRSCKSDWQKLRTDTPKAVLSLLISHLQDVHKGMPND